MKTRLIAVLLTVAAIAAAQAPAPFNTFPPYKNMGAATATSFSTIGAGAGSVGFKDSLDANSVTIQGYIGTRSTNLILGLPSADPTSLAGTPIWNAPSAGLATFNSWINPVRQDGIDQTQHSTNTTATCLASTLLTEATPLNAIGNTFSYHASGAYSSGTAAVTFNLTLSTAANCGGTQTTILSMPGVTVLNSTGSFDVSGYFWDTTTGASGTISADMIGTWKTSSSLWSTQTTNTGSSPVTLDTTKAYYANFVISWVSGTPTVVQRNWIVNRVN